MVFRSSFALASIDSSSERMRTLHCPPLKILATYLHSPLPPFDNRSLSTARVYIYPFSPSTTTAAAASSSSAPPPITLYQDMQTWQAPWSSFNAVEKSTLLKRRQSISSAFKARRSSASSKSVPEKKGDSSAAPAAMSSSSSSSTMESLPPVQMSSPASLQRIFFSPHPDDVAYSAFGTASKRPRCCAHDDEEYGEEDHHRHDTTTTQRRSTSSLLPTLLAPAAGALPSPALSSSSRMSYDSPSSSSSSSIFSNSRRNSAHSSSASSVISTSDNEEQQHQNALIVTVFSKSRCANGEIGARLNRNVEETTVLRTEEDEAFARSIGCDLLQLGFPDSSARDEPSRRPDLAAAAMKGAPGAKVADVDHYIYQDVRRSLEPIVLMAVRAGAKIHLPLGVGCHVDHWMVRVAVLSLLDELDVKLSTAIDEAESTLRSAFSTHMIGGSGSQEPLHERLIFYEDLPYADAQTNEHVEKLAASVLPLGAKAQLVPLTEEDWCRKRAAILAYASQMKPTIIPSLYNHATRLAHLGKQIDPAWETPQHHLAAERIWIIDAELRRRALALQRST